MFSEPSKVYYHKTTQVLLQACLWPQCVRVLPVPWPPLRQVYANIFSGKIA